MVTESVMAVTAFGVGESLRDGEAPRPGAPSFEFEPRLTREEDLA